MTDVNPVNFDICREARRAAVTTARGFCRCWFSGLSSPGKILSGEVLKRYETEFIVETSGSTTGTRTITGIVLQHYRVTDETSPCLDGAEINA